MEFKKNLGSSLIAAAALAALAAGCSNNRAQTPPTVVETPAPPTNTTVTAPTPSTQTAVNPSTVSPQTNNTNAGPGGPTGDALGDKITREIHTNAQMTGSRITAVSDASGTVRLTGRAQDQQQRALAVKTAHDDPGTTGVVDKIQIIPTGGVKEAAAPKVVVKKYFYVRQTPAPSTSMSTSTGAGSTSNSGMNGTESNPKHPTTFEDGASSNSLDNDANNGGLGGNSTQGQ